MLYDSCGLLGDSRQVPCSQTKGVKSAMKIAPLTLAFLRILCKTAFQPAHCNSLRSFPIKADIFQSQKRVEQVELNADRACITSRAPMFHGLSHGARSWTPSVASCTKPFRGNAESTQRLV
ncbi:unnamed protein product [Durusdinium trenchii]|uniref:Uncharacterized protein n=1 Tax=Durusdinium trenchii TaxID=1381693 RepID=A0ABP0IHA2_9DINO